MFKSILVAISGNRNIFIYIRNIYIYIKSAAAIYHSDLSQNIEIGVAIDIKPGLLGAKLNARDMLPDPAKVSQTATS